MAMLHRDLDLHMLRSPWDSLGSVLFNATTMEVVPLDGQWALHFTDAGKGFLSPTAQASTSTHAARWLKQVLTVRAGRNASGDIFIMDPATKKSSFRSELASTLVGRYQNVACKAAAGDVMVGLKAQRCAIGPSGQLLWWRQEMCRSCILTCFKL